jgi:membrane protease YdiL (CAAX protease family)
LTPVKCSEWLGGRAMAGQVNSVPAERPASRAILFVLFLIAGLAIFLFGNNWNDRFPTNTSTLYKASLPIVFLALAVALHRSEQLRKYWRIAFALFIGAFANWLNWTLGNWLPRFVGPPATTAQDLTIDKLSQCVPVVLAIIVLTKLAGDDLGSIFLKQGDLKEGLRFGLISFGIFAAIFAVIAVLQASAPASQGLTASGVSLAVIVAALPWMLVWAFANSLMEELWFRGIFLKKLSPFLGATATIVVTSLVFSIPHAGATYISPLEMIVFPIVVFCLGLVNARMMLKTDSIVGSFLFHAGYDLLVIIPNMVAA